MSARFDQLLQLLPLAVWETFGARARRVEIHVEGQAEPISFPVGLVPPGVDHPAGPGPARPNGHGEELPELALSVAKALEEAGRRLSSTEIRAAVEAAGEVVSDSTLRHLLARLVKDGILTSRIKPDTHGRGYGLAEWT